jgi:uncharacterized protein with HEPN domain
MSPDLRLYLTDILVACKKVLHYTNGMNFEQFIVHNKIRFLQQNINQMLVDGRSDRTFTTPIAP